MLGPNEDAENNESQNEDTESSDTTEESSEDTQPDDSDDSASDDGDTQEDGKSASKYFFDPDSVPDDLKPTFKRMQATYTRRLQGMGLARRKSDAFDQLVADPDFRAWMQQRRDGIIKPKSKKVNGQMADTSDDSEDTSDQPDIRTMIREELAPILSERQSNKLEQELADFKKKYPNWVNYREELKEELEANPHLTYVQAYRNVAFDDVAANSKTSVQSKKNAQTNKPNKTDARQGANSKPKNIAEAFAQALKTHGPTGKRGATR